MSELPKLEVYFYFCVWISGVSISLYRLYLVGQVFDHRHHDEYHYEDFRRGWTLLGGRFQDQSDSEWNIWTNLFVKLTPFLLINFLGAEYLRRKQFWYILPSWYSLITIVFLLSHFKPVLTIWFIMQTLIYAVVIYLNSYLLIWIISFLNIFYFKPDVWFVENDEDQYLVMVASCWMVLRCISYSVDKLNEVNLKLCEAHLKLSDNLKLLGFSFYLPTMFCGPFICYNYFEEGILPNSCSWSFQRFLQIIKNFSKCVLWFTFTIFALHFVYVNAILLRPEFVKQLTDWELSGLGIAMGHFFHLKYIVFYGLPCAWASAEGFTTPKLPCCVSRVHLYSYMWRHFDHGLYQFLIRYIYVPVISYLRGKEILRKVIASVFCFIFIFVWHGGQDYVFFWVLFNYVAVTLELLIKETCSSGPVKRFLDNNFSEKNQIRLQCFFAAPLHCFSMISNYFFIGNGVEIGLIYLNRIIYGTFKSKIIIFFFLYGAGQSAVATQKSENLKKDKKS